MGEEWLRITERDSHWVYLLVANRLVRESFVRVGERFAAGRENPSRRRILIEEFDGEAAASEVQARALAGGLAGVPDKDAIDENPLDARW